MEFGWNLGGVYSIERKVGKVERGKQYLQSE